MRIIQLASRRDRLAGPLRQVNIIADELRFQISGPVLTALSTARDKGVRLLLACQSVSDLRASENSMDKEALAGIVVENTPIKLVYRVEDPVTAELMAKKTGAVRVMEELRETQLNLALTETMTSRSLRETTADRVDQNTFLSLPAGVGVFMFGGDVRLLHITPLIVEKNPAATCISPASDHNVTSAAATSQSVFDLGGTEHDF